MTNGKDYNKNKNFILSVSVLFMTGFTISAITFWFKQDYKVPEWYHYSAQSTRAVERWESNVRSNRAATTTRTKQNKEVNREKSRTDQQSKRTAKKNVQFILKEDYQQEVAEYLWKLNPDPIMMASFYQESAYRSRVRGKAGEYWLCQLMPNKTNNVRIKDKRRNDWRFQVEVCVSKWKAVSWEKKWLIRASYWSQAYKKYLYIFKK